MTPTILESKLQVNSTGTKFFSLDETSSHGALVLLGIANADEQFLWTFINLKRTSLNHVCKAFISIYWLRIPNMLLYVRIISFLRVNAHALSNN